MLVLHISLWVLGCHFVGYTPLGNCAFRRVLSETLLPKCAYRPWDHFKFSVNNWEFIIIHMSDPGFLVICLSSVVSSILTIHHWQHFMPLPPPSPPCPPPPPPPPPSAPGPPAATPPPPGPHAGSGGGPGRCGRLPALAVHENVASRLAISFWSMDLLFSLCLFTETALHSEGEWAEAIGKNRQRQ